MLVLSLECEPRYIHQKHSYQIKTKRNFQFSFICYVSPGARHDSIHVQNNGRWEQEFAMTALMLNFQCFFVLKHDRGKCSETLQNIQKHLLPHESSSRLISFSFIFFSVDFTSNARWTSWFSRASCRDGISVRLQIEIGWGRARATTSSKTHSSKIRKWKFAHEFIKYYFHVSLALKFSFMLILAHIYFFFLTFAVWKMFVNFVQSTRYLFLYNCGMWAHTQQQADILFGLRRGSNDDAKEYFIKF